jgi:transposase
MYNSGVMDTTFTLKQIEELGNEVKQNGLGSRYFRRVQTVNWLALGKTVAEVINLSGFSRATVFRIRSTYLASGLNGLQQQHMGSHHRKLSYENEAETLSLILGDAVAGKLVRASDIKKQFEELSGVTYNIYPFYRLLKRHNWRKAMPRGQHPKAASEEAIEASKKLT